MNWSPLRSVLFDEYPTWASHWRGVGDLQDRVNQLFSSYSGNGGEFPSANIFVTGDKASIKMELPGVKSEDLDVSVVGRTLSIRGKRASEELKEEERFVRRERGVGDFSRTIELPFPVNNEAISAAFKCGVLTITAPRAEADKPKRIEIK